MPKFGTFHPSAIKRDLIPHADNVINLGSSTKEFRDLRLTGDAYIDNLAENMAVSAGVTIDGVDLDSHEARHRPGGADAIANTKLGDLGDYLPLYMSVGLIDPPEVGFSDLSWAPKMHGGFPYASPLIDLGTEVGYAAFRLYNNTSGAVTYGRLMQYESVGWVEKVSGSVTGVGGTLITGTFTLARAGTDRNYQYRWDGYVSTTSTGYISYPCVVWMRRVPTSYLITP